MSAVSFESQNLRTDSLFLKNAWKMNWKWFEFQNTSCVNTTNTNPCLDYNVEAAHRLLLYHIAIFSLNCLGMCVCCDFWLINIVSGFRWSPYQRRKKQNFSAVPKVGVFNWSATLDICLLFLPLSFRSSRCMFFLYISKHWKWRFGESSLFYLMKNVSATSNELSMFCTTTETRQTIVVV